MAPGAFPCDISLFLFHLVKSGQPGASAGRRFSERTVSMEFQIEPNRIYSCDSQGTLLAEVTFPTLREGVVTIDHTFVDASLRGQGVASKLMRAAMEEIIRRGLLVVPTCSYAVSWLQKHPEYADILAQE